jgi:threonyl-tRNA synthetase
LRQIEIINGLPEDATISLYRVGPMVDLCHGPHLPNTSFLKAAAVTNVSRAFWRADVTKEPLQRVYGITFPDSKQLKEYQHREWPLNACWCLKTLGELAALECT